jgi:hypothetical protein
VATRPPASSDPATRPTPARPYYDEGEITERALIEALKAPPAQQFDPDQPRDDHGRFADGGGGVSEEAGGGSARVREMNRIDQSMREESQWQRLMRAPGSAVPEVVSSITREDAIRIIGRLNRAPGDNPRVRAAIKDRFPDVSTERP